MVHETSFAQGKSEKFPIPFTALFRNAEETRLCCHQVVDVDLLMMIEILYGSVSVYEL